MKCVILEMFLRWKYAVLDVLFMWLSNVRPGSKVTPRFLTTMFGVMRQPSMLSVRSDTLFVSFLWPGCIISILSECKSKKFGWHPVFNIFDASHKVG